MTSKVTSQQARQALSLGYALPVIGTTLAIVLGLMVRDLTQTDLNIWIWVLIQLIIGFSLIFGTWYANVADGFRSKSGKRLGATKGARLINFIIGIIWSAVVTIMAFAYGQGAVEKLTDYQNSKPRIRPLTWGLILDDWLPALTLLLIAAGGIYLLLWARTRDVEK
jgi:hypothetical protein